MFLFLKNKYIIAPTKINKGANASILKATNIALIVVPTFAPIIMPIDCVKLSIPEFTKLTVIIVVAVELLIATVATNPTKTAKNLFDVAR